MLVVILNKPVFFLGSNIKESNNFQQRCFESVFKTKPLAQIEINNRVNVTYMTTQRL